MTLQPPGMPPGRPPGSSGSSRSSQGAGEEEARLLNILARESGGVERKRLCKLSGWTASQFNDWLKYMREQEILEVRHPGGEDLVVLRRS